MGRILTVEEAAAILKITPHTLRQWLARGVVPGKKIGRMWRINEDELMESMRANPLPGEGGKA